MVKQEEKDKGGDGPLTIESVRDYLRENLRIFIEDKPSWEDSGPRYINVKVLLEDVVVSQDSFNVRDG